MNNEAIKQTPRRVSRAQQALALSVGQSISETVSIDVERIMDYREKNPEADVADVVEYELTRLRNTFNQTRVNAAKATGGAFNLRSASFVTSEHTLLVMVILTRAE